MDVVDESELMLSITWGTDEWWPMEREDNPNPSRPPLIAQLWADDPPGVVAVLSGPPTHAVDFYERLREVIPAAPTLPGGRPVKEVVIVTSQRRTHDPRVISAGFIGLSGAGIEVSTSDRDADGYWSPIIRSGPGEVTVDEEALLEVQAELLKGLGR